MKQIDFRSDTVTQPTPSMWAAMSKAKVGDDVYGEDPTVNELESLAARLLGKEAALYVCSGTQSNLLGLLAHCERGEEYIVGQTAHTYRSEGGGAAVLGSIQPQPLTFEADGTLDLAAVERAIKPDDFHYARTRLLCLENTQGGKVLPLEYLGAANALARRRGLGIHLDGARIFNAAVKLGVDVQEIARHFDSISFCLSKGLGAPVGSLLCGTESFIRRARRWRKVVGGGMRQAGVIAAAGIVALTENVARLAEDHENARVLAAGLSEIDGLGLDPRTVQTNMVFLPQRAETAKRLQAHLRERGILISAGSPTRLVTHLDIDAEDVRAMVKHTKAFFATAAAA